MKTDQQLRIQAMREIRHATEMREKAFAMREKARETRLRLWLNRLNRERCHNCRYTALEHCLDAAISVASADYANIQLVHASGRGLELKAQRGFSDAFLNFFEYVENRDTACGVAFASGQPITVEDVACSEIFAETESLHVVLDAGVRSVRSIPLLVQRGHILGVLSVHYRKPTAHVDSDVKRLQKLAGAVAVLIEREPRF